MKRYLAKLPIWWVTFLFSFMVLTLFALTISYLRMYFSEDIIVSASGRQILDFRVFYLENEFFDENPIPQHLNFLISYTDYIEVDNSFTANFSEDMDIYYSYRAEKRLVIQYNVNNLNHIVFEKVYPLSEISGVIRANALAFDTGDDGSPSGTYTIYPKDYIELYQGFIEEHISKMETENTIAQGLRNFSAELFISFAHSIYAPYFDLDETLQQSYQFSLSAEIYSFEITGESTFEWENDAPSQVAEISLPIIISFIAVFALSVLGLLYSIREWMADPNPYRQKVNNIMQKYSSEIVVYDKPVDLRQYTPIAVQDFPELLKLAINLNKHIMCYKDKTHAEFVTIVDGYACTYRISFYKKRVQAIGSDDGTK